MRIPYTWDKGEELLKKGKTTDAVKFYAVKGNAEKILEVIEKEYQEFGVNSARIVIDVAIAAAEKVGKSQVVTEMGDLLAYNPKYKDVPSALNAYLRSGNTWKIEELSYRVLHNDGEKGMANFINMVGKANGEQVTNQMKSRILPDWLKKELAKK